MNLNITKGTLNLTLIDYNGMEFDFTISSNSRIEFTLDDTYAGISLQGLTFDDDTEVVYHATAVSTTASPTATEGATETVSTPVVTVTTAVKNAAWRQRGSIWALVICLGLTLISC